MFLGSREETAHLGYVLGQCPKCGNKGVFTVYESRRKLTISAVIGLPIGQQQVLECRACGVRFALPAEMREQLLGRLISADQLADYVGRLPTGNAALSNGKPVGRTLYQVLQVDQDADPDVIEAAFKRLALKFHPDRSPEADAAERMRELLDAKAILSDPAKRRAYDRGIGIERKPPRPRAMRPEEV